MTNRTTPFDALEEMFKNMSRQFEQAAEAWETGEGYEYLQPGFKTMAIDVREDDDEFVVTVEVPGFERDDIDITVSDGTLTIEAEREYETATTKEDFVRRERQYGTLTRSIRLPEPVEADEIVAKMDKGELTITIPRTEFEESGRKIPIAGK